MSQQVEKHEGTSVQVTVFQPFGAKKETLVEGDATEFAVGRAAFSLALARPQCLPLCHPPPPSLSRSFSLRQGFPTLMYFSHGNLHKFSGQRKIDTLLAYAKVSESGSAGRGSLFSC